MNRSTISARLALLGPVLLVMSGVALPQAPDGVSVARQIAEGLIAACPLADPADETARDQSAEKLTRLTVLRDSLRDPLYWGGHTAGKGYAPEENALTLFNPFVWRRMYLSLFMFPGPYRIERAGPYLLLRLPYQFRNRLDPGAYPYPFWHSKTKWDSYQLATELILVFEQGKITAAYRSDQQDPGRPYLPRVWDGRWRWSDAAGREMPYVALYAYLFSPQNPHAARLDAAYRALEAEARQYNCVLCHSPDNVVQMNPLRLLNFPNQALTVRHQIVEQLEANKMPFPSGIADAAERRKLIALARDFAAVGDQAWTTRESSSRKTIPEAPLRGEWEQRIDFNCTGSRGSRLPGVAPLVVRVPRGCALPFHKYPTLDLADVYAVIVYYLRHREAVDEYVREREIEADEIERQIRAESHDDGLRERLLTRRAQKP